MFYFPWGGNNSQGLTLPQLVKVEWPCWVLWHAFSPQWVRGIKSRMLFWEWRKHLKNVSGLCPKICCLENWVKHKGTDRLLFPRPLKRHKITPNDLSLYRFLSLTPFSQRLTYYSIRREEVWLITWNRSSSPESIRVLDSKSITKNE